MTLSGDKLFIEVIKLNEVIKLGPDPVWLEAVEKGKIWTQMQTLKLEHHHVKVKAKSGQYHFAYRGILKSASQPQEAERQKRNRLPHRS